MSNKNMSLEDALRVADIFEADDVISVPAMAGRVLAKGVRDLEKQIIELKLQIRELHWAETESRKEQ